MSSWPACILEMDEWRSTVHPTPPQTAHKARWGAICAGILVWWREGVDLWASQRFTADYIAWHLATHGFKIMVEVVATILVVFLVV